MWWRLIWLCVVVIWWRLCRLLSSVFCLWLILSVWFVLWLVMCGSRLCCNSSRSCISSFGCWWCVFMLCCLCSLVVRMWSFCLRLVVCWVLMCWCSWWWWCWVIVSWLVIVLVRLVMIGRFMILICWVCGWFRFIRVSLRVSLWWVGLMVWLCICRSIICGLIDDCCKVVVWMDEGCFWVFFFYCGVLVVCYVLMLSICR